MRMKTRRQVRAVERQIVRGSAAAVTTMLTATQGTETAGMWLVGSVYNVCTPHRSLGKRTPAQAAGLTDHRWTMHELLTFPVPLPVVKRRGRPPQWLRELPDAA